MGLTACPVVGKNKSINLVHAFMQGAPKDAQGFVFFGVDQSNWSTWKKVLQRGLPYYYIDNAFFDHARGTHFRVARNRLQIDAAQHTSDCKRWDAMSITIHPRRESPDGAIVLCEQSDHFMQNLARYPGNWLDDQIKRCQEFFPHLPVIVRRWDRNKRNATGSLPQDLANAWQLRTHTSMAAITGLIHGLSVITAPEHAIAKWMFHADNYDEDRRQLFGVLADAQWAIEELKEGKAWRFLNP